MRVLLINPPYLTLTSTLGVGHQVPLGLLMIGGPLIDARHQVKLLDAECLRLSIRRVVREVQKFQPDVVMTGHASSTPAHPVCMKMLRAIKTACPEVLTVYGGVYPTYHAADILQEESSVDVIVRGEGEAIALDLVNALEEGQQLDAVEGICFRKGLNLIATRNRIPIRDWTAFGAENYSRNIVQLDQSKWDYRHQIFEQKHLKPWQLLLAVKWLELRYHFRPKRLFRILNESRPLLRRQLWWNLLHTSLVWCGEILAFVFSALFAKKPVPLAKVYGNRADGPLPILLTDRQREASSKTVEHAGTP